MKDTYNSRPSTRGAPSTTDTPALTPAIPSPRLPLVESGSGIPQNRHGCVRAISLTDRMQSKYSGSSRRLPCYNGSYVTPFLSIGHHRCRMALFAAPCTNRTMNSSMWGSQEKSMDSNGLCYDAVPQLRWQIKMLGHCLNSSNFCCHGKLSASRWAASIVKTL